MPLNIGYVHNDTGPSAGDNNVVSLLQARGHTVTLINELDASPPPSGYDVFLISESGSASTVGNFTSTTTGVLCFETAWSTLGIATVNASSQGSSASWDLEPHEITTGLPDPLTVHGGGGNYGVATADLAAGVELVASMNAGASALLAVSDTVQPGPRGCAALIDSRTGSITSGGVDLIEATLEWMAPATAPPGSGSASGSFAFGGSATGSASHSGQASGTFGFTGSASGSTSKSGQAQGTYGVAATASGSVSHRGTASGGWVHTGSASGSVVRSGTASGGFSLTATATGSAPAVDGASGTATGTWQVTTTASGSALHRGSAATGWSASGTATGTAPADAPDRDVRLISTGPPASQVVTTGPVAQTLTVTEALTGWSATGSQSPWTETEPGVDPLTADEPALRGPTTTAPGSKTTTTDPEL